MLIPTLDLQSFVEEDDLKLYGPSPAKRIIPSSSVVDKDSVHSVMSMAQLSILNPFDTHKEFETLLRALNLTDHSRLRPTWDTYFMSLAELASLRSNCMKRRVGAILVRNNRIVSTGYNGTPRGLRNCNEGGCERCNGKARSGEALDECLCLHAEENALLEAGRERVGEEAVLYCNT